MVDLSEKAFEEAIECALLAGGPDACPGAGWLVREEPPGYGEGEPGGYRKRTGKDYDPARCLLPRDGLDFVLATQPKEWERLRQHHGAATEERFLTRLARELERRGTLDVLRKGIKDHGCKFRLAYFRPASGLNEEVTRLHEANFFAVVRQLHYSERDKGKSLDLALFLNGLPIFTAELKNPLTGQDVEDARKQYSDPKQRDPREPLLSYGRCLAHFAVDEGLVRLTTRLAGKHTRFLPFDQGRDGGAGNPPVSPTRRGYATSYLWERTWTRDSVLDLVRNFIQEIEEEDEEGRKTGERHIVFPRYQQLDCVRRLVAHAREHGPGQRYLIQHSAGSGKSLTIGWLAHQLSTLHDAEDRRVFDTIVVITDRRVLDRQLQRTVRQLEQTLGLVENIDKHSRQLREALEGGKTIVVTTLQKFPVIAGEVAALPGKRFAVIVDEAHSSQTGESTKSMKAVLASDSLEAAEAEEAGARTPEEELEDEVLADIQRRGRLPNLSLFAFTATPKPRTLELFGHQDADGRFVPFHLYSMRQAIEERFILDVLANYTTYGAHWALLKKIEDDPRFDKEKASYLLRSYVELHPHAVEEKVRVMLEHFVTCVAHEIGGRAKAMIVTRSRRHAVRFKLALDAMIAEKGHRFRALVAFSSRVTDGGKDYTEAGMNGFPEAQTAKRFERPENRFLVVASKFQTGFDQPLLHTMYVDKKLGGVNAVQTLSRLNRTCAGKRGTMVLDFANEAPEIQAAFAPYYERTLLKEGTDPNLLYEVQGELEGAGVFEEEDVEGHARIWFRTDAGGRRVEAGQDEIYAVLAKPVARYRELPDDDRKSFRSALDDFVRLYAFLSQVISFADPELEKLYAFARALRKLTWEKGEVLPVEVLAAVDMESYQLQLESEGDIRLRRGPGELEPMTSHGRQATRAVELEPLSRILDELNRRFGLQLADEERLCLEQTMNNLATDQALDASARVNTRENARLAFDRKLEDAIQRIVDSNFQFYRRITDDREFGAALSDGIFDEYMRRRRRAERLVEKGPSSSVAFLPTLPMDVGSEAASVRSLLEYVAGFLNSEGGDLLVGVEERGRVVGLSTEDRGEAAGLLGGLVEAVRAGLGEAAAACVDPGIQLVQGRRIGLLACRRAQQPIWLRGEERERLWIRRGASSVALTDAARDEYVQARFSARNRDDDGRTSSR